MITKQILKALTAIINDDVANEQRTYLSGACDVIKAIKGLAIVHKSDDTFEVIKYK